MTSADDDTEKVTVYFDGSCPLCTKEIAFYKRQDGADAIHFVDVSDPTTPTAPDLSREQALKRFHIRQADGTLVSGAAAFAGVWAVLPRWAWAAKLSRLPGVSFLLQGLYRLFLPIRPILSRLVGRLARRS